MLSTRQNPGERRPAGWLLALVGLTGGVLGPGCSEAAQPAPDLPNIVLVVIDTLRPDHLSPYGYEQETAPFLAELATRSVVFERAFSTSSWTAPSTASIFTGLYPNQHGVIDGFKIHQKDAQREGSQTIELVTLPTAVRTLPQRLTAAGYRAFGVSANINIGAELGFTRGFERFERLHKGDSRELAERVLSWRGELTSSAPSFLYLHFNDVHMPYRGREPWYEQQADRLGDWIAKYDSEIRYLDETLADLARELDWDTNTVILVASDHGEEFMDHGAWGHRFSLHYELNHVLMMLHTPETAAAPGRVESNVGLVDVLPTLLEFARVEPEPEAPGRSLVSLAAGREDEFFEQRTLFAHRERRNGQQLWAAIRGDWKLIDEPAAASASALYDLRADSAELNDLASARADVAADMRERLARFREEFPTIAGDSVDVDVDEELLEHLKGLGYVGDE